MEKACPKWIHYLAIVTMVLTWLLIIIGGVVHGTGSSLACPDWPTCYGSFFPEMVGGVFFEHSHRLVAASTGLLTVILWISLLLKGPAELRKWSLIAVLLVIFQGVLGGITVIHRLPTAVSTAHLATSMMFFALLGWIVFRTRESSHPLRLQVDSSALRAFGKWVGLAGLVIYLQIVLGALVRHTGAGLACLDFPLCQGSLWPATGAGQAKLHMLHRWGGVIVALTVFATVLRGWKLSQGVSGLRPLLGLGFLFVILQIFLGYLSVASALGLFTVSAHLGTAALLWIDFVWLSFTLTGLGKESSPAGISSPAGQALAAT